MIWLIGGPARCGKSTLLRQARTLSDGQVVSVDNLKEAILPVISKTDLAEVRLKIDESETTPEEWIKLLRRRDRVFWEITRAFAEAAVENDDNAVIEGNFWPDFVAELPTNFEWRIVFLVDTSPNHPDRIIEIARSQKPVRNNWMRDWTDERLRHWGTYNIARSQEIKRLGAIHNQPVFDVADGGLTAAQTQALSYLRQSIGG